MESNMTAVLGMFGMTFAWAVGGLLLIAIAGVTPEVSSDAFASPTTVIDWWIVGGAVLGVGDVLVIASLFSGSGR
jgi:hypothetical protein